MCTFFRPSIWAFCFDVYDNSSKMAFVCHCGIRGPSKSKAHSAVPPIGHTAPKRRIIDASLREWYKGALYRRESPLRSFPSLIALL